MQWGSFGSAAGQLNMPWGVAVDAAENVYVADWRNDRLQVFDANGQHLAIIGSPGMEDGQFRRPAGLCMDGVGNLIVTDWGNEQVQILQSDGTHLATLYGDATLQHSYSMALHISIREGISIVPSKRWLLQMPRGTSFSRVTNSIRRVVACRVRIRSERTECVS